MSFGVLFGTGNFWLNKEVEDLSVVKFNNNRAAEEKTNEYHQNIRRNLIVDVKEIRGKWTASKVIGKISKANLRLVVLYINSKVKGNLPKYPDSPRARSEKKNSVHHKKTRMTKMGILRKVVRPLRLLW